MLARARSAAPGARFRHASFVDEPLPTCVGVLAVGEVLSYTTRGLEPVFRRVYRALRPGGLFVLDMAGPGRGPARTWAEGPDWAVLVDAEEDPRRRLLTRRMTTFRRIGGGWRRGRETHQQRLHPSAEIAKHLRRVGFRVRIRRGYRGERFAAGHYVAVAGKPSSARARPRRGTGAD